MSIGNVGRISGKSGKCLWEEWGVLVGRVGSVSGKSGEC